MIRAGGRAALAALVLVALAPVEAARWPEWAEPGDASYLERFPDADAVVVLDEWQVKLVDGTRTGRRRWLLHVLTEDGREHASLTLASGAFGRYSRVKFWVRQADGAVDRYSEEDGTLLGDVSRRILDETEVLVLEPPRVAPGTLVAVEADFARTPDIPQDLFRIQQAIPVARAAVTLERLGGWSVEPRLFRGADPELEATAERRAWVFRNLPGREGGEASFSPEPPRTLLVLNYVPPRGSSPFTDWASTASWGRELFGMEAGERPALARASGLLGGAAGDPVRNAGRLARELRYFGIELGWGGYRPRDPETTLERRFGDCKDKAQLMISLLRHAGVDAVPVLVVAPSDGFVADDLPSPFHFNHAVVGIPWDGRPREPGMTVVDLPGGGPLRIYDATLAESSAQDIGYWLEGGAALVLRAGTAELLRLPGSAADNLVVTAQRWRLSPEGALTASETTRYQGAPRLMLENEYDEIMTVEELREELYAELTEVWPGLDALTVGAIAIRDDGAWTYDADFRVEDAAADFDELRALELGELRPLTSVKIPHDEQAPAYQSLLATWRKETTVELDGRSIVALPEPFEVENALGRVRVEVRAEDGRVEVVRELALLRNEVPYELRDEARTLRNALRRANGATILLGSDPGR